MTVDRAIKILSNWEQGLRDEGKDDGADAMKLGIEALKRVIEQRNEGVYFAADPLPGETAN